MRKNTQNLLILTIILISILSPCAAATADEVTNATVTPSTQDKVVSDTTQGGNNQFVVIDTSAYGLPTNGSSFANINSGNSSQKNATYTLKLKIPSWAKTLSFDWIFATNETYIVDGKMYWLDWANVTIINGTTSQSILYVDTSSTWFPADGLGYGNRTDLNTTTVDITDYAGSTILLQFFVSDYIDQSVASALFIDNINIDPVVDPNAINTTNATNATVPVKATTVGMQDTGVPLVSLLLAVLLLAGGLVLPKKK